MNPSDVILPHAILADKGISRTARDLYAWLLHHRNRKTGQCNPRHQLLAAELDCSRFTVMRAQKELVAAGWLVVQRWCHTNHYRPLSAAEHGQSGTDATFKSGVDATTRSCTFATSGSAVSLLTEPIELNLTPAAAAAGVRARVSAAAASVGDLSQSANTTQPEKTPENTARLSRDFRETRDTSARLSATPNVAIATPDVANCYAERSAKPVLPTILPTAAAVQLADELLAVHPEPGLPQRAAPAIQALLDSSDDPAATIETLREHHAAWRAVWQTYGLERFIPQLWRWCRDGDWLAAPVARKPVERALTAKQKHDEEYLNAYLESGA